MPLRPHLSRARRTWIAILAFVMVIHCAPLMAQEKPSLRDGSVLADSLDDWVNDNIDPDVLRLLNDLDDEKAQKLLAELQQAMDGTNIYKLATLRQTATQVIPVLQKFDETAPLSQWLQTRLDYLQTAQELERQIIVTAPKSLGSPPPPPTLRMERDVWKRTIEKRPWPPLAAQLVPKLKVSFAAQGAPPELVWLAEVESSFNAKARSPAGAAGMFQLMPQTARDQQLSIWPWDERLQPEKSAAAAARYLRALHSHYGDWELALAAYNAGEGRVDKLLKQQNAHSFEAIARRLPAETQLYVPKVEATVRRREGVELQDLKMPRG